MVVKASISRGWNFNILVNDLPPTSLIHSKFLSSFGDYKRHVVSGKVGKEARVLHLKSSES